MTTPPHEHDYIELTRYNHAPTGPEPEHTAFILLWCPLCLGCQAFPRENYERTTPEFQAEFKRALWTLGHFLLPPDV
jgi:hypothetical protein